MQTTIRGQIDTKKPSAAFIPTGEIKDCKGGCFAGKCNMCKYKQMAGTLMTDLDQDTRPDKATLKKKKGIYDTMMKSEPEHMRTYMKEMGDLKQTMKKEEMQEDEKYVEKFGLLKKASVLTHYGRDKDAFDIIKKAAKLVQHQKKFDEEKYEAIKQRWTFKLGLDEGLEINENLIKNKMP